MKENMTASGTHDSDPWNFVKASMHAAKKPAKPCKAWCFFLCSMRGASWHGFAISTVSRFNIAWWYCPTNKCGQKQQRGRKNETSSLSSFGGSFARSGAAAGCKNTSSDVRRSNSSSNVRSSNSSMIPARSNRSVASQNSSGIKKSKINWKRQRLISCLCWCLHWHNLKTSFKHSWRSKTLILRGPVRIPHLFTIQPKAISIWIQSCFLSWEKINIVIFTCPRIFATECGNKMLTGSNRAITDCTVKTGKCFNQWTSSKLLDGVAISNHSGTCNSDEQELTIMISTHD